jgi:hypothetical protein
MVNKLDLSKIYFIFYIPGSMGSLLSILIKSQIENNFKFDTFGDNTAHRYIKDTFSNTHSYIEYLNFKKTNISLEKHLEKNFKNNNSLLQRCDINWLSEFLKIKNTNYIISYISNYEVRLFNFYIKLKKLTLESSYKISHNFEINKNHKDYETIIFIKTINWLSKIEKKYLNVVPSIDMLSVVEKKFDNLTKFCKITNLSILKKIIDDYNSNQSTNLNIFPESIKKYIKKYKNQV